MNILGYMQKVGKALMVPVATLPAAAILMGIGYWLDPVGWGSESILAAFLIKSGGAIIDNMAVLFAVGVAFGLSRDKNGSAALSGFVMFLVVTTLLAPGSVAQLMDVELSEVP
ncbi:PTS transporter subunit EIIC, partial [Vibrio sp. 10N.222.51.A6]